MLQTFDDLDHTSDENKHNDAMIHTGVFFGWSALKMSARPLGNSDTWNFFDGVYNVIWHLVIFKGGPVKKPPCTNDTSLTWFDQHLEFVFVRPLWKIQCLGYGATWAQLRRSLWHMRQKVHVKGASFSSLLNRDIIRKWGKSWEGRSRQWCGIDYGVCCYSQLGSLIPSVYHVTFCALLVINIIFCWNF